MSKSTYKFFKHKKKPCIISYTGFFDYVFEVDGEKERSKGNWSVIGAKASPIDLVEDVDAIDAIKYGDGFDDVIKYGNLDDEIILWQ